MVMSCFRRLCGLLSVLVLLGAGCAGPALPPAAASPTAIPRTPTPVPATDEAAILQLLAAEGEAVVMLDIERLMDIWAEDGVVADARHTPGDAGDDLTWRGRDAIYQRYVTVVFPGNPMTAGAIDAQVTIAGDRAEALATTRIGTEVAPGGDRWTFARRGGRWLITNLTYNLEAK
jgi:ketosteroid isomerase-like protein